MLVDETSDSVETVKKEPPFAKISTGNANRTTKQKEVHPNGREKFITYLLELQISHSACAKVPAQSDIWKVEKRYRQNSEDALRLQAR
jgi:hypothetical protein